MGWTADTAEFRALGADVDDDQGGGDATAMAQFWCWGYDRALDSVEFLTREGRSAVVVSHAELTAAGTAGQNLLRVTLGLDAVTPTTAPAQAAAGQAASGRVDPERLHNFNRTPAEVLSGGRAKVDPAEVSRIERMTAGTWSRLEALKLPVLAAPTP
jgi:hypothetical protein